MVVDIRKYFCKEENKFCFLPTEVRVRLRARDSGGRLVESSRWPHRRFAMPSVSVAAA